jgi:copper chaperone CopZ
MNRSVINIVLVVAAAAILTLLAVRVRVGATADSVAVLTASGMTCGSCAARITRELESLKGVAAIEVDTEGGRVVVGYDMKTVKPEALKEQINRAGFSSTVQAVVSPEQFKRMTGREIGRKPASRGGCCGGCGSGKQN